MNLLKLILVIIKPRIIFAQQVRCFHSVIKFAQIRQKCFALRSFAHMFIQDGDRQAVTLGVRAISKDDR